MINIYYDHIGRKSESSIYLSYIYKKKTSNIQRRNTNYELGTSYSFSIKCDVILVIYMYIIPTKNNNIHYISAQYSIF